MNLEQHRNAAIRQKQEEAATLQRDIEQLRAVSTLLTATQYALDFAAPEESVILREELAHTMAEDLSLPLDLREGDGWDVDGLINRAIAAGELEAYGLDRIIIPTRTFIRAKLTS